MAYRIRRKKSIQKCVRSIAGEQIDRAIDEILNDELDLHETVHQVRKRCKKLRGLIRLVRPVFDDFPQENRFFRDAARELSYVRDSQSMIECFTALIEHFGDQVDGNAFASIHDELARRRQAIADDDVGLQDKLKAFLSKMREARQRVDQWQIDDNGFSAVSGGLMKTYGRGRKALRKAYATPTTENFHEWRKRAKYHWYHARLLQSIWTDMMDVQCDAADRLSDVLGEDHDLGVFRDTLLHDPDRFGSQLDLQAILGLIDRRRAELQAQAQPLGERLLAEKPKKLAARFGAYFRTWQATKKFNPKLDHDLTRTVA